MSENQNVPYHIRELDELRWALQRVAWLLEPYPLRRLPLTDNGGDSYQHALNVLHIHAPNLMLGKFGLKRWLELGLDSWEEKFHGGKNFVPAHFWLTFDEPPGVSRESVRRLLRVNYLGQYASPLQDRLCDLLARFAKASKEDSVSCDCWYAELGHWIRRRSHCDASVDPHRDERLRDLLMQHYELDQKYLGL